MDEATQQAVQLGVNVLVFIIALSVSITLLIGVRDVAEKAFEYDSTIPAGSRVLSVESNSKRTISGNELLSYYSMHMTAINNMEPSSYVITIENKEGTRSISSIQTNSSLPSWVDLNSDYEVIAEKYDELNKKTYIKLKEIE